MLPKLFSMCERNSIPATFFELTSTLAFIAFHQSKCEAIVVEVGLGGKLDSTNIITPTLCIITSIQLDHVQILGDTIEKIAAQKAGESGKQRKWSFPKKIMCLYSDWFLCTLYIYEHSQYNFFAIHSRRRILLNCCDLKSFATKSQKILQFIRKILISSKKSRNYSHDRFFSINLVMTRTQGILLISMM